MRYQLLPFLLILLLTACRDGGPATTERPGLPAPPDVAAPPPNSLKSPSGLSTRVLQPGTGQRHPRASDTVVVHYTG